MASTRYAPRAQLLTLTLRFRQFIIPILTYRILFQSSLATCRQTTQRPLWSRRNGLKTEQWNNVSGTGNWGTWDRVLEDAMFAR